MPLPLAFALERGIATVLAADPDTRERLARLDGRVVRVRVDEPAIEFALAIVDARVDVLRLDDGDADVTISGSLSDLRSLANGNDALYAGRVRIDGDVGVAQQLRDLVGALDIDLEEIVAPVLGGTLARRVGLIGRDVGHWLGRSRTRLRDDARDYLEEEVRLVPVAEEVNRWSEEVDELRGAGDRLAARVARLERRRAETDAAST